MSCQQDQIGNRTKLHGGTGILTPPTTDRFMIDGRPITHEMIVEVKAPDSPANSEPEVYRIRIGEPSRVEDAYLVLVERKNRCQTGEEWVQIKPLKRETLPESVVTTIDQFYFRGWNDNYFVRSQDRLIAVDGLPVRELFSKFDSFDRLHEAIAALLDAEGFSTTFHDVAKQACESQKKKIMRQYFTMRLFYIQQLRKFCGFSDAEASATIKPDTIMANGVRERLWLSPLQAIPASPCTFRTPGQITRFLIKSIPQRIFELNFNLSTSIERHEIEYLLKAGLPVPPEKLAEFPDLALKYGV